MARPRDEGFSLLEVLFASFIAFFVLTALFGVLVMSASQGRIASSDVVSTNLVQLVVEQARSLPYASVGVTPTPAGEVSGVLASSETTLYQGTTFTIKRDVYWVADPMSPTGNGQDYKKLVVSVSWTGGHATPAVTFIRDHTNETPTPPMVAWTVNPPANAVLFSNPSGSPGASSQTFIWDNSSDSNGHLTNADGTALLASLQASASVVTTTGTITRIELQNNGVVLAAIAPGSPDPWPDPAYPIDLTLTTSTPTPGTLLFKEGLNTIKVVATANNLAYAYQILLVTVDNHPPEFQPGDAVTLAPPDDNGDKYRSQLSMTWPVAMDGQDAATSYDMILEPPSSVITTNTSYPSLNLGSTGSYNIADGSPVGFAPVPGTPYRVSLKPKSIRGLLGSSTAYSNGYAVAPPRLDGTVWNLATKSFLPNLFEFHLTLTHSNDAALLAAYGGSSIKYDVYSVNAAAYPYPGGGDLTPSTPGFIQVRPWDGTSPIPADAGTSSNSCNEYLQVDMKVMASDGVTVLKHVRSNVIGPPLNGGVYSPPGKGATGTSGTIKAVSIP